MRRGVSAYPKARGTQVGAMGQIPVSTFAQRRERGIHSGGDYTLRFIG
jgi:hypothetical protein